MTVGSVDTIVLDNYDVFTEYLARYPVEQKNAQVIEAMYLALGLTGEAGEVSEKIKKWHRDGVIDREQVAYELGDVLYYLTRLSNALGYTLYEVLDMNMRKLTDRRNRNVLHGNGDNR
jgi:NTP pyrophosphatase (non-canonical NTP hydrolase)